MLLVQTNRCLRAIFLFVIEAKELFVILPIPARIANMLEALVLDLPRDIVERRENVR